MYDITLKSKDPLGPRISWIIHAICKFDLIVWYYSALKV